eukprot:3750757-Rhodomonas_salina.3
MSESDAQDEQEKGQTDGNENEKAQTEKGKRETCTEDVRTLRPPTRRCWRRRLAPEARLHRTTVTVSSAKAVTSEHQRATHTRARLDVDMIHGLE